MPKLSEPGDLLQIPRIAGTLLLVRVLPVDARFLPCGGILHPVLRDMLQGWLIDFRVKDALKILPGSACLILVYHMSVVL